MARKKNWKRYLQQQRRIERYTAGIEAVAVEARLKVQLPAEVWDEVEARWAALDDSEAYLPQQRLRFLEKVAREHDVSLVGVGVA
jgi:hypothetical protein